VIPLDPGEFGTRRIQREKQAGGRFRYA